MLKRPFKFMNTRLNNTLTTESNRFKRSILTSKVIFFGLAIAFSTLVPAFLTATPLFTPVVITFDDSVEVRATTSTLIESFPKLNVISYKEARSNYFVARDLARSVSELILVGHGSEEGIFLKTRIIRWESIGEWVNKLPVSKVIYLSCNSFSASEHTKKSTIVFPNIIDGITGALSVSMALLNARGLLDESESVFSKIINRIIDLIRGNAEFMPLYYSSEEEFWNNVNFIYLLILTILSTATLITPWLGRGIVQVIDTGFTLGATIMQLISYASAGLTFFLQVGLDTLLNLLINLIGTFFSILSAILAIMPWWEAWRYGVVAAEAASELVPLVFIVNLAAYAFTLFSWAYTLTKMYEDINDPNGDSQLKMF